MSGVVDEVVGVALDEAVVLLRDRLLPFDEPHQVGRHLVSQYHVQVHELDHVGLQPEPVLLLDALRSATLPLAQQTVQQGYLGQRPLDLVEGLLLVDILLGHDVLKHLYVELHTVYLLQQVYPLGMAEQLGVGVPEGTHQGGLPVVPDHHHHLELVFQPLSNESGQRLVVVFIPDFDSFDLLDHLVEFLLAQYLLYLVTMHYAMQHLHHLSAPLLQSSGLAIR